MISEQMRRKLLIINAVTKHQHPTLEIISKETGIPIQTVKRQLDALRDDLGVIIEFVRSPGRYNQGHYVLRDWGIIKEEKFLPFLLKII